MHEESDVDVGGVVMSEARGTPLLVSSEGDYPRTKILDAELGSDLKAVLSSYGKVRFGFEIVTMDPSERRVVLAVYTHANRDYYLIDRETREMAHLGQTRSADFSEAMSLPEAVSYTARDGLNIHAYLLRPVGAPSGALPMVVLIHGGPWARVTWSDPDGSEDMLRAQFLANRGYAVLIVNYRGSTGYGRAFMAAAVGEFGAAMQDDIVDGVSWAVEQGIADPNKVAVMGHSYGGYAALMALAQHPKGFACGIDVAGPTDLARLIEDFPPYWELELAYWYSYVGDPAVKEDRERMQRHSPVYLAREIERPVLIIQGAKDVRVPLKQSAAMADELHRHARSFEYLVLDDMGHSTGYWAHHLFVLRHAERFLADCLGGRAARFDRMEAFARLSGRLPLW